MVIGNGFFTETEQDALQEMTSRSGCQVKRCVYPTIGNLTYYISEQGHLFGMQRVKGTGAYITRGPKKPDHGTHAKRKDGGITLRLCESPKHERSIKAELLVFCTFILGSWQPDVQVVFKDGNAANICKDNLELKKEDIPPEWRERMEQHTDVYKSNFNRVVSSVTWWCGISQEDAKDVTQSTFIWLLTDGYRCTPDEFAKVWTYWAKKRGMDYYERYTKLQCLEDNDEWFGQPDIPYEVDLFHLQKGEKRQQYLKLWAQGHTPTEIAEMCDSTIATVSSSVTRSIQYLQNYLKNEKELLK